MEGYEGFSEDMAEMFENSNHSQKKQEFFKASAVELGLDKVESCIGVLPGKLSFVSRLLTSEEGPGVESPGAEPAL